MMRRLPLLIVSTLIVLSHGCDQDKGRPLPPRDHDAYHERTADLISFDNEDEIAQALDGICAGMPANAEEVLVQIVNDGDTITLTDGRVVCYTGIDAPEPHHEADEPEPFSADALQHNKRLLNGKTILLVRDEKKTYNYGRTLAYVFAKPKTGAGETIFVNGEMVLAGYALAKRFPPNLKHSNVLSALEEWAGLHGRGLWQQTPYGYVGSKASHKFHRLDCTFGRQIHSQNLVEFGTRREAFEAGYVPCKSCKP